MRVPWSDFEGPAKLLAICVAVLLIASGLCGMQWLIAVGLRGGGGIFGTAFIYFGILELIVMAGSIVVAVATLIFWGARTLLSGPGSGPGRRKDEIQKLFAEDERGEKRKTRDDDNGSA